MSIDGIASIITMMIVAITSIFLMRENSDINGMIVLSNLVVYSILYIKYHTNHNSREIVKTNTYFSVCVFIYVLVYMIGIIPVDKYNIEYSNIQVLLTVCYSVMLWIYALVIKIIERIIEIIRVEEGIYNEEDISTNSVISIDNSGM